MICDTDTYNHNVYLIVQLEVLQNTYKPHLEVYKCFEETLITSFEEVYNKPLQTLINLI